MLPLAFFSQFAFFGAILSALLLSLLGVGIYRHYRRTQRDTLLIQAQKKELEQLNAFKDVLFSVISHELRHPLNSLKAFTELRLQNSVSPDEKADFERLDHQIGDTINLLDNLLQWSAVQTQRLLPQILVLSLKELADEVVATLQQEAARKMLKLEHRIPVGLRARGDANMIRAVLRNLLHNAIKFSPPASGQGVLLAANADAVAGFVEITVFNQGAPIPVEQQAVLFTSGHTVRGTAGEKGAGIGLQLCKEFVETNGGRIGFSSDESNGTRFWFTLPV